MSRKLLHEGHALAKPIENDGLLKDVQDDSSQDSSSSTGDEVLSLPDELEPIVTNWLPPRMLKLGDNESAKMRMTAVDGAFQFYGHEEKYRHKIRAMR